MPNDDQMEKIMKEFTSFLGESDQNPEFQTALNSVVKEVISKESMYEPMKKLKDAFPEWLEANWDKIGDEELERFNKQLDKVTEICVAFETDTDDKINKDKIFEMLNALQELGHPPEELMTKIHGANPMGMMPGMPQASQGTAKKEEPAPTEVPKLNNPFEKME
jgi:peroxin-19